MHGVIACWLAGCGGWLAGWAGRAVRAARDAFEPFCAHLGPGACSRGYSWALWANLAILSMEDRFSHPSDRGQLNHPLKGGLLNHPDCGGPFDHPVCGGPFDHPAYGGPFNISASISLSLSLSVYIYMYNS